LWELAGFGNRVENVFFRPCRQDVVALCRKRREYFDYLLGCLAGAVNHLREALTNLAMMVNTRKTQVLERQMPEFFHCLVDCNIAFFYLLQQLF
jgi:hypothetical protein